MNLIIINSTQTNYIDEVAKLAKTVENEMEIEDAINKVINMPETSNNINEIALTISSAKISNLALITGTKDNRLIQVKLVYKSSRNEKTPSFITEITNHSFQDLQAETIALFSKTENRSLELMGYEALGYDDNLYTYIKDREKIDTIGRKKV